MKKVKKTKRNYKKGGILSRLSPAYAFAKGGPEGLLESFSVPYMLGKKFLDKDKKKDKVINMTKSKEFNVGDEFNTGTGGVTKLKKGGKVGKPRGCGAALRGYGKAMKGSK